MSRLDPRSSWVLDTKEVGRRPGSMTELTREVAAPAEFGTDVMAVAEGDPISVMKDPAVIDAYLGDDFVLEDKVQA